jgi:hypothetical protein
MKKLAVVFVALMLTACATPVQKVDSGQRKVGERMEVFIDGAWNKVRPVSGFPGEVWTMEGIFVDELMLFSGVKDGTRMHPENPSRDINAKNFVFRSGMKTEEVVAMFEGVLSRGGSTVTLTKVEPTTFGGKRGFRFDYERVRKVDSLKMKGFGFGLIDGGELFALVYHAPRLTFFDRHAARVEGIARSIAIRG